MEQELALAHACSCHPPQDPVTSVGAGHRCNPFYNKLIIDHIFMFLKMADDSGDPGQYSEEVIEYNIKLCGDLETNLGNVAEIFW